MAIAVTSPQAIKSGFIKNATSADASGTEEIIAAPGAGRIWPHEIADAFDSVYGFENSLSHGLARGYVVVAACAVGAGGRGYVVVAACTAGAGANRPAREQIQRAANVEVNRPGITSPAGLRCYTAAIAHGQLSGLHPDAAALSIAPRSIRRDAAARAFNGDRIGGCERDRPTGSTAGRAAIDLSPVIEQQIPGDNFNVTGIARFGGSSTARTAARVAV